jgi:hypothetical protein
MVLKVYAALLICFSLVSLYYAVTLYFIYSVEVDEVPYMHYLVIFDVALILISLRAIYKTDLLSIKLLSALTVYLFFSELLTVVVFLTEKIYIFESDTIKLTISSTITLVFSILWYFILVKVIARLTNMSADNTNAPNE